MGSNRRRRADPYEWADYHGITVVHTDLGDTYGEWCPDDHMIRLHHDLTGRQDCSTLWHECGHYALGHDWGTTPTQERDADSWAASILITADEYRRCEQMYGRNPTMIAEELDVMVWVVRQFRRDLEQHRWRQYFSNEMDIA